MADESASPAGQRAALRAAVPGACAMALVGGSVGISRTLVGAPLFTAQGIRYALAVPLVMLLARTAHARIVRPRGREWFALAGIAATGLVLFNVAVVRGVAHAEPAVIAVAVACVPILLGVVGPLLQRQAPRQQILMAAVIVTTGGALVEGAGRTDAVGVAWAAVALLCEASFTLLAVPVLPRLGAWSVSLHSMWLAAVMLLVLGGVIEGPTAAVGLTVSDWAAIGYLAVFVTAVAFILWYSTVAALGPGRVGLLTGVAPVSAAATGTVIGGHTPSLLVWLGIFSFVFGVASGLRTRVPFRVERVVHAQS